VNTRHSRVIHHEPRRAEYLEGDGNFRSEEVTALREEADIVVTNPPFSEIQNFIS
jgi:predicted RNA methylase